jgi:uncharacterized phage-associated protein
MFPERGRSDVPGWSPEIANEFVRLASADDRAFDQSQLQKLVYIAHGWCLALHDQPLTGDRPEAWEFGPVYRRLADALARYGRELVNEEIGIPGMRCMEPTRKTFQQVRSDLDQKERELIRVVYDHYGMLRASQLSNWTRKGTAPWSDVFAGGAGEFRDIPHSLVKAQFVELAQTADLPKVRP